MAADYAGQLIEDQDLLKRFIRNNQRDRSLLQRLLDAVRSLAEKLTGGWKARARSAQTLLEEAVQAAAQRAGDLQQAGGRATMEAIRYSQKEGGTYETDGGTGAVSEGRESVGGGIGASERESAADDRNRTEYAGESARNASYVRDEGLTEVAPAPGSPSDYAYKVVTEYHVPIHIISEEDMKRLGIEGGFARDGEVYLSDGLPEQYKEALPKHELIHVMAEVEFQPYLEFNRKIVNQLVPGSALKQLLLDVMSHKGYGGYLGDLSLEQQAAVFDEFNAMVYGSYLAYGEAFRDSYGKAFKNFDRYIGELSDLLEQFKERDRPGDHLTQFSLKGSREMQQAVKELMERTDREAGWTEAEFRREVDQIARRIYGAQVAETKARAKARAKQARTQRSAAQLRRQITRHAGELSQKLRKPTDNRHIPEELRRTAAALLDAINLESAYTADPETGKRTKNGGGDPVKRTEAFRALKEQYQAIVNDEASEFVVDPNLFGSDAEGIQGNFDKVLKWKDVRLADMNLEQLETVWQVIRAVEKSITTAGKTLTAAKYESTKQWADALAADTATRKDKGSLTRSHASLDLETPLTFFSHYGNAGNQIYRMLRDAQDKQAVLLDQVARAVDQLADRKQVRAWEKESHTFQVEGGELTLTTAQLMDLYELSKRKQAQDHLYRGGIVQPEVRSARIRAGTDGVRVTPGDVADMLSVLTDEQRQAADALHPDRAVFLRSAAEIQKAFHL